MPRVSATQTKKVRNDRVVIYNAVCVYIDYVAVVTHDSPRFLRGLS
jgi:hypothetical protein